MRHLHAAAVKNIRTLKKYTSYIWHNGSKIPVAKWNAEVKEAVSLRIGSPIPIPYNGKTGILVDKTFDYDQAGLRGRSPGRRFVRIITGYTLVVKDGINIWNVFRVPSVVKKSWESV